MKIIAALIINWNGAADSLELISSLCQCQNGLLKIDIVIIDNASASEDVEQLQNGLAPFRGKIDIVFRANKINIGVPAGYNQCIQLAGLAYDYYLRLDNDVVVSSVGLQAMIDVLDANYKNGVGIVGGNVRYYDRPEIDNGGAYAIDLVKGVTTVSYPVGNVVCDGVLGCIMLVSGRLVRRYAPDVFDPVLFICTDESELSLRARIDGNQTLYISNVIGLHKGGVSTGKVPFLSRYYSARNWTILRWRFASDWRGIVLISFFTFFDLLKSTLRFRWAYPLGFISGAAISIATAIDRRIQGKR
jgi:GT2 family glycosyltransferase